MAQLLNTTIDGTLDVSGIITIQDMLKFEVLNKAESRIQLLGVSNDTTALYVGHSAKRLDRVEINATSGIALDCNNIYIRTGEYTGASSLQISSTGFNFSSTASGTFSSTIPITCNNFIEGSHFKSNDNNILITGGGNSKSYYVTSTYGTAIGNSAGCGYGGIALGHNSKTDTGTNIGAR